MGDAGASLTDSDVQEPQVVDDPEGALAAAGTLRPAREPTRTAAHVRPKGTAHRVVPYLLGRHG